MLVQPLPSVEQQLAHAEVIAARHHLAAARRKVGAPVIKPAYEIQPQVFKFPEIAGIRVARNEVTIATTTRSIPCWDVVPKVAPKMARRMVTTYSTGQRVCGVVLGWKIRVA